VKYIINMSQVVILTVLIRVVIFTGNHISQENNVSILVAC